MGGSPGSATKPALDSPAPCVSVLMPCRNAGAFLEEAIASALADPLVLELLIADGGSTDGSLQRIEAHARADRRVRLVSRCDIDAQGRPLERYPSRAPQVGLAGFRDYCFLCQPTVFWRRTLTLLVGPWNPDLRCAFDFDYWLRAFQAVPGRIGHLPELQAQSRLHGATLSATLTDVAVLEATRLQLRHLPNPSPHILLAYAADVLAGTTAPPAGRDPHAHLVALLQELRPQLGEHLWRGVRDQLPALAHHLAG